MVSLDTSTLDKLWYRWSYTMAKKTGYHISTDPVFYLARTTKASKMRLSKWTQGLGQSNNQCMPLSRAQICWILACN